MFEQLAAFFRREPLCPREACLRAVAAIQTQGGRIHRDEPFALRHEDEIAEAERLGFLTEPTGWGDEHYDRVRVTWTGLRALKAAGLL